MAIWGSKTYVGCLISAAALLGWAGYNRGLKQGAVEENGMRSVARSPVRVGAGREAGGKMSDADVFRAAMRTRGDSMRSFAPAWQRIGGFTEEQVKQTLEWLKTEPPGKGAERIASMLYSRWGQLDPLAAIAALQLGETSAESFRLEKSVVVAWMKRDPDAAGQWGITKRDPAISGMIAAGLMLDDTETAFKKAAAVGSDVLAAFAHERAKSGATDPAARSDFLVALAATGDPEAIKLGKLSLLNGWSAVDPQGALEGLASLALTPEDQKQYTEMTLRRWSYVEPEKALRWIAGEQVENQANLRLEALGRWTLQDPLKAEQWIEQQEDAGALMGMVVSRLQGEMLQAGGSCSSAGREATLQRLRTTFTKWRNRDPAQATRWLQGLDPVTAEQLGIAIER